LPGTNTLAYYENSLLTAVNFFITLAPEQEGGSRGAREAAELQLPPSPDPQPPEPRVSADPDEADRGEASQGSETGSGKTGQESGSQSAEEGGGQGRKEGPAG
jgi:hypothetical protein